MDSSFLSLVAGFLAGTLVSALLLFLIFNQNKKRQAAAIEERNQVIRSIAENFTDIDTLVTSFRTGLLSEDKFRTSLCSKLDAANKIYKPNMHLLDLYFVKFTDLQFTKYSQIAYGKIPNLQFDSQPDFNSGMDSVDNLPDLTPIPNVEKNSSVPETGFFTDNPVNGSSVGIIDLTVKDTDKNRQDFDRAADDRVMIEEDKRDEFDIDHIVKSKEEPIDVQIVSDDIECKNEEQVPAFEFTSLGPDENPVSIEEEPVIAEEEPVIIEDKPIIAEEEPVIAEDRPVIAEEEPVIVEEEPVIVGDQVMIEEKYPVVEDIKRDGSENFADEIIFEVSPEKTSDKKNSALISDATMDVDKKPDSASTDKPIIETSEEQKSSFQKEFEQVAKEMQDEELMETIMDLDMGKFLRTGSINIESIDKNALPPKYASSAREAEGSKDLNAKKEDPSENTIKGQEKIVVARGDNGSSDTILDEAPANFELNSKTDDSSDVSITGDDVASKIDSFFGIK